jgi:tetratricopeptide (TPR) repeat protein
VFARAVKEDENIKTALNDVLLYKIDCEKGEGIGIAKKYEVKGYPTFIAMNGAGQITDRWIGYEGPEAWAKVALAAAADPRTIQEKKAAYKAEPTVELARCLANDAATAYDFKSAVQYHQQAREMDPANAKEYTHQILTSMYYGSRGGAFTFDEVEAEAKPALSTMDPSVEQHVELALMLRNMARQSGQPERALPYIKTALKASAGSTDESISEQRVHLEIDHALLVEQDSEKALQLFRSTLDEGWMDNSNKLNNFAWWCFENDVNLEEAEEMALRGVELADSDAARANVLDTAAEICNKLGNCEEAIERIKRAIALAPDRQYFKDQLIRFEKELADKRG